jgi:hypothetical protein
MAGSKKFIHDRVVLLLISTNTFLAVFSGLTLLLRLSNKHDTGLIVEYRSNLGLSAFKPGDASTFIGFAVFLLLVVVFHIVLAQRIYYIRRHFAQTVLALGTLLIILAAIVSNSLLGL